MLFAVSFAVIYITITLSNQPSAQADITVNLGSSDRAAAIFSFPTSCSVRQSCDWTLSETIVHYLTTSARRDGYPSATVLTDEHKNNITVTLRNVSGNYGGMLAAFLNAGDLAMTGAVKLHAEGFWKTDWYSFLPLGMPLQNRRSVQLLHFPPDYTLTEDHDYLSSKTTVRWASLLVANGVNESMTASFQATIDIAPVAAPATAGASLAGVYSYYTEYVKSLIKLWSKCDACPLKSYLMVAFGEPVRLWLRSEYGITVDVLHLGRIHVPADSDDGRSIRVLGANHPSKIWYAADPQNHGGNEAEADKVGLENMQEDLTAACWQAGMGLDPDNGPESVLDACKDKWTTGNVKLCEMFYTSVRQLSDEESEIKCRGHDEL